MNCVSFIGLSGAVFFLLNSGRGKKWRGIRSDGFRRPHDDHADHDLWRRADGENHKLSVGVYRTLWLDRPAAYWLAFTLTTSIWHYHDYDAIDESPEPVPQGNGGICRDCAQLSYRAVEKQTINWDFHSLLLSIQMKFSFMLLDEARQLRLCKHCQKVFIYPAEPMRKVGKAILDAMVREWCVSAKCSQVAVGYSQQYPGRDGHCCQRQPFERGRKLIHCDRRAAVSHRYFLQRCLLLSQR